MMNLSDDERERFERVREYANATHAHDALHRDYHNPAWTDHWSGYLAAVADAAERVHQTKKAIQSGDLDPLTPTPASPDEVWEMIEAYAQVAVYFEAAEQSWEVRDAAVRKERLRKDIRAALGLDEEDER